MLPEIDKQFDYYHKEGRNQMVVQCVGPLCDLIPYFLFNWVQDIKATATFTAMLSKEEYKLLGRKITHIYGISGLLIDVG